MIFANRLNVMLLKHYSSEQLLSLGQVIQLSTATMLLTYITLSPDLSLPILVGMIMLFVGAQSFIVSNANSSTIEFFPHNSGTASALLGATGFATGALAGTVVGLLGDGTPFPMAAIMLACIVSGISLRFLVQRY
jgi:DHA1 family bicyclomycin/chloramphenicol resistance-like MFS transporter